MQKHVYIATTWAENKMNSDTDDIYIIGVIKEDSAGSKRPLWWVRKSVRKKQDNDNKRPASTWKRMNSDTDGIYLIGVIKEAPAESTKGMCKTVIVMGMQIIAKKAKTMTTKDQHRPQYGTEMEVSSTSFDGCWQLPTQRMVEVLLKIEAEWLLPVAQFQSRNNLKRNQLVEDPSIPNECDIKCTIVVGR